MSNVSPRLQQYNNPESYAMGKEAAKFLIGQLFLRQITPAEFEKQFGTVEKYICWYELQNDLPNSFITDGEEMCELLKMISPSGAEDYKQECLKRMAESKKIKEEREKQATLEKVMSALNITITSQGAKLPDPPTMQLPVKLTADPLATPIPPPTPIPVATASATDTATEKKKPGRKKKHVISTATPATPATATAATATAATATAATATAATATSVLSEKKKPGRKKKDATNA